MNDDSDTPAESSGPGETGEYHNTASNSSHYNSSIGVDTVKIMQPDFIVDSSAPLKRKTSVDTNTGETTDGPLYQEDGDGRVIEGTKAYIPPSVSAPAKVTIWGIDSLWIEVSLPKLLSENNTQPIDTGRRVQLAMRALDELLRQHGITADLNKGRIMRLDVCRNIWTEGSTTDYRSVVSRLQFPRMEGVAFDDNGGYMWKNGSRQVVFYGKGNEQGTYEKLQRLEYRFLRNQSLREQAGIDTVTDLQEQFPKLYGAYREAVSTLFPDDEGEVEADPSCTQDALEAALEALDEESGSPLSDLLKALGVQQLRESGDIDAFLEAIEKYSNRQSVSRYSNTIEELAPIADVLSGKGRSERKMLEELRSKFLG